MRRTVTDMVTYAFVVAGILVFTKPGSQGIGFVKALFGGFTNLVQGASGQQPTRFA